MRRRGSSGRPSVAGFSVNVIEWQPFAATRRISAAHSSGSHSIGSAIGMNRPGIGAAPLVDVPVVVRLHDRERELLVVAREEQPAGERRERREAHAREHAARAHVLHPLVHVVATGAHLVEGGRVDAVLLLRPAGDRVEPDVGDRLAVEHPHVVAGVGVLDAGRAVGELRRHPALEQVRRLDEVVVDADEDHVLDPHAGSAGSTTAPQR